MKTQVSVCNYGTVKECRELAERFSRLGYLSGVLQGTRANTVVLEITTAKLGEFFTKVSKDPKLDWITYTLQVK